MPLLEWEHVQRDDPDSKACVTVTSAAGAIVGGMTGSFLGPAGTVAGYAGGAVWGFGIAYLACPYLVPAIKGKIESGIPLTDAELRSAAEAMGRYANVNRAPDAVRLVAVVRSARQVKGLNGVCRDPSATATQILARRG
jgi:hypothetical protein